MSEALETRFEEDLTENQGIHPLHRGYMFRKQGKEYMFPPSAFAEAKFIMLDRNEKKEKFDALVKRVMDSSKMADSYPDIAEWIEKVNKHPRIYAERVIDKDRADFIGLSIDIQHSNVELIKEDGGQVYIEKNGLRIPVHRHRSSLNLVKGEALKAKPNGNGNPNIPYYGKFSPYGNISLRVKSKERGNHPEAMAYWDVLVSNPFILESGISNDFDVDEGTQYHRHHKSKGWLWSNFDEGILNRLDEHNLPNTRESETIIVDFHKAVALTKIYEESQKPVSLREIQFLDDEVNQTVMPYSFTHVGESVMFNAIIARYGLGKHYEDIDQDLLDKDIAHNTFGKMFVDGNVTREAVKNTKRVFDPVVRDIIKTTHFDLVSKGYNYQGFSTVLKETDHETIGITHVKDDNSVYILYNPKIKLPLMLGYLPDKAGELYGSDLRRVDNNESLLFQERFSDVEYRTGKLRTAKIGIPNDDKYEHLYDEWKKELRSH